MQRYTAEYLGEVTRAAYMREVNTRVDFRRGLWNALYYAQERIQSVSGCMRMQGAGTHVHACMHVRACMHMRARMCKQAVKLQ